MFRQLHQFIDRSADLPGVLQWRKQRFRHDFANGLYGGVCDGVFGSYAEAVEAAPKSLPLGYDNADAAAMYRERLSRIYPSDYAPMLWLQKALESDTKRIFDLDGHVGIAYYAYQRLVRYPPGIAWQVCDVPAVVLQGRELAAQREVAHSLTFTEHFIDGDGADILFTSGCLQYLEDSLAQRIAFWESRPKWVLVNLLPLHEQHAFWTVQNIGTAFCPYRIQQTQTFFDEMATLGYELLDKWENLEKRCEVKFAPAHSLDRYYGAAFRLK
jgi:putative methyltransferase (TIGR04325 family)